MSSFSSQTNIAENFEIILIYFLLLKECDYKAVKILFLKKMPII